MAIFSKDFSNFLAELEINNNREWFNANKSRFKTQVEEPFLQLITEVISRIKKIDKKTALNPKDAVFRIYRDVRFSQDKSPYKTYVSAIVTGKGRKDMTSPGMYIEIKADGLEIYCGVYMPDAIQLKNIRYYISKHLGELSTLLNDKAFKSRYKTILGEKNKVIPSDLKTAAAQQALIYNKQFYFSCKLPKKTITSEKIVDEILACYQDAIAMNQFLAKAMK